MRSAALLGLTLTLVLAPGCRRKAVQAPPTPWLEVDQQPPEEGAMGVLSGPARGQQEFQVLWVKPKPQGGLPGFEFLNRFRGPRPEKVMAVECLSLSSALVAGEPSEHPAVFWADGARALIWGGPSGWGWVDLTASRARVDTLDAQLETILAEAAASVRSRSNADGWTLHNRLMLTLTLQPVRTEPRDDAPYAAQGFPDGRLEGEALWRHAAAKEFAPGRNAPPHGLEDLDVQRIPKRVREILVNPLERRGDWVRVAFPETGTPTYLVDAVGLGENAENQALLVKWNPQPAGWVRLYRRGPVQGTSVRLWGWRYLGSRE